MSGIDRKQLDDLQKETRDIAASLIGKTIASIEVTDNTPNPEDWGEEDSVTITFTDGTAVEVSAWGHDAWGVRFNRRNPDKAPATELP